MDIALSKVAEHLRSFDAPRRIEALEHHTCAIDHGAAFPVDLGDCAGCDYPLGRAGYECADGLRCSECAALVVGAAVFGEGFGEDGGDVRVGLIARAIESESYDALDAALATESVHTAVTVVPGAARMEAA